MKKIFILFILLIGCIHPNISKNSVILSKEQCKNVPEIWWGEQGEDPSKCDIWKCFSWELRKQE